MDTAHPASECPIRAYTDGNMSMAPAELSYYDDEVLTDEERYLKREFLARQVRKDMSQPIEVWRCPDCRPD